MLYSILGEGIKTHICEGWPLTQQVIDDLLDRKLTNKVFVQASSDRKDFLWDAGGTLYRPTFLSFPLDKFPILCYNSQWEMFRYRVTTLSSDKYKNRFYKLGGYLANLCLSPKDYAELLSQVKMFHELGKT